MDEFILYLNTADWAALQARLAEPPRVLPRLTKLLRTEPEWDDA